MLVSISVMQEGLVKVQLIYQLEKEFSVLIWIKEQVESGLKWSLPV